MKTFMMQETDSWEEQRIALLILKFLTEQAETTKNGFMSILPLKVKVDGVELTYEQLQNINPRTNKQIEIIQDNGPMPETGK